MIPSTRQLIQQIKQAMNSLAPGLYRKLEVNGELEDYAEQKAEAMLAEFGEQAGQVMMQVMSEKANLGAQERVQQATSAERRIWEGIVANHLEFPAETTTASSRAS